MKTDLWELISPSTKSGSIFYAILFLAIAVLLIQIIKRFTNRMINHEKWHSTDKTAILFYARILQLGSIIILVIIYFHLIPSLRSIGTALLASAGIVSVVGGLAAQKTLGNIVAGISLLFYRPFRVGDRIQISAPTGVETGTVEMIDLGYTILISKDNRKIYIPNNILYESVIINLGHD